MPIDRVQRPLDRALPAPQRSARPAPATETPPTPATSANAEGFDEVVEIRLGVDPETKHLVIAGGDVRREPRRPSSPVYNASATQDDSDTIGALVNLVA